MKKPSAQSSSWGPVATWYDQYLESSDDTYQEKVIWPNLLRAVAPKQGETILDVSCGQGFFTRKLADAGAAVVGADISPELIALAKERSPKIPFHIAPASDLSFATDHSFATAVLVLAIQNIKDMQGTFDEVRRVLAPSGRMILVLNHPAFRVPKRSSWGWDEKENVQFRRIDAYLSADTVPIVAHPGKQGSAATPSYHRSLQDFFKALSKSGFAVSRLEEWISQKESGVGPRKKAEDTARKEFPLFLMLEATALTAQAT